MPEALEAAGALEPNDRLRLIARLWASLPADHWAAPTPYELHEFERHGMVFHGALLARLVGGASLENALEGANAAAALSCRGLDGRSAIPTAEELDSALAGVS